MKLYKIQVNCRLLCQHKMLQLDILFRKKISRWINEILLQKSRTEKISHQPRSGRLQIFDFFCKPGQTKGFSWTCCQYNGVEIDSSSKTTQFRRLVRWKTYQQTSSSQVFLILRRVWDFLLKIKVYRETTSQNWRCKTHKHLRNVQKRLVSGWFLEKQIQKTYDCNWSLIMLLKRFLLLNRFKYSAIRGSAWGEKSRVILQKAYNLRKPARFSGFLGKKIFGDQTVGLST